MSAVTLRIYDLSQGMARSLSPALLGKQIDAIYHTSLTVYNLEYYFGGGICSDPPGATPYGTPISTEHMGSTDKTQSEFQEFLGSVASQFSMATYHLLENNCNNFTEACCRFLVGRSIPQHILDLPREAMDSPLGPMLRPLIEQMQSAVQQQSIGHEVHLQQAQGRSTNAPEGLSGGTAPIAGRSNTQSNLENRPSYPYWMAPVTLEKADRERIRAKLREYATGDDGEDNHLMELSLSLPAEKCFPALDLLRLRVAESELVASQVATAFRPLADNFILDEATPMPARMMALRVAVNVFKHPASTRDLMRSEMLDIVIECVTTALPHEKAQVRKVAALLALNLAGAHRRDSSAPKVSEDHCVRLVFLIVERLNAPERAPDDEARALISTLIVLVDGDEDALMLVKTFGLELGPFQTEESCDDVTTRTAAAVLEKLLGA